MAMVLPIPLPESLVTERRIVAKNDFAHTHHTVAFGPDHSGYVHSEIFYNYYRYNQGDDDLSAQIVTRLSPDFSITSQVWLEDLHREMKQAPKKSNPSEDEFIFNNNLAPLAVTERGEVVFTTSQNRMFVYDAELATRIARFDPLRGEPAGFSDVIVVPGGLVAVRDRDRIGVAGPGSFRDGLPDVRLVASVSERLGERGMRGYLGRFAALDQDRLLVTQFVARGRSGWIDTAAFSYTVLGGDGQIIGSFPLGAADTPYGKTGAHDDSYVAHRRLGGWLVRSDAALHVFDRDGARALRIGLAENERFAAVVPLTLSSVGPNGELVMVSKKHHVLVVSDPIDAIGSIEAVLAEVGAVYATEVARLKKAVPFSGGRWFGFEPKTPRAVVKAAKTKKPAKAKPAPVVVEPPPPPVAATPAEAVSLAPHDVDTLSVYADSLADTDLGEYINVSIRLHRMAKEDPEREDVETRVRTLFRANGARWLRAWNTPNELFEKERYEQFCGLPCGIAIDGVPAAIDALDRQVAGLPIQTLAVGGMSTRELPRLEALQALRRITRLLVSADSKHKLAKPALAWIAARQLVNLRSLHLYGVTVTGSALRDVLDTLPQLDGLTVMSGQLSAEGVEVIANTSAGARIEKLGLSYNPLGSAAFPMLARFPRLAELDLNRVDLGDDIAAMPPPEMTVTKLGIDDNPRLGAKGLRWLVDAMPGLRGVRLPRTLSPDAIEALVPVAPQLEAIDVSWMEAPAKEQLVEQIVAKGKALRRLRMIGDGGGFVRRILDHTQLDKLETGDVTDDDVAALADAQTVTELGLDDGANDDNLGSLARTARLPKLRSLYVHSRGVTESGILRLLLADWPAFARLELMYAQIGSASILDRIPARPFVLRLFKCEITKTQLDHLRRAWGDRLIA